MVVVYGGGDGQPVSPLVLLVSGKESEVLFNPLIFSFREAIGLWVVGRRQILFGSQLGC